MRRNMGIATCESTLLRLGEVLRLYGKMEKWHACRARTDAPLERGTSVRLCIDPSFLIKTPADKDPQAVDTGDRHPHWLQLE